MPENSASCLVISLSDRLGKGPTPFHLQQLALRSRPLPELRQTAGLASSTKCFSGTAPCLISRSALKNFRVYWASLHNWLLHRCWGQHFCCDSRFCLDSYLRPWLHCLDPGHLLPGNGWSAFAPFCILMNAKVGGYLVSCHQGLAFSNLLVFLQGIWGTCTELFRRI